MCETRHTVHIMGVRSDLLPRRRGCCRLHRARHRGLLPQITVAAEPGQWPSGRSPVARRAGIHSAVYVHANRSIETAVEGLLGRHDYVLASRVARFDVLNHDPVGDRPSPCEDNHRYSRRRC